MAEYKYVASYPDGRIFRGRLSADSPDALKQQISAKGAFLIECNEVVNRNRRALKSAELAELCREMSSMLCAGITVAKALEIIRRRKLSRAVMESFDSLSRYIERGGSLSAAMERQDGVFPDLVVKVVAAGEESGTLDKVFTKLAEHFESDHRRKSELLTAVTYPAMLFIVTLLVIVAIFVFVFPAFSRLFDGMVLPLLTQIMMWISSLFTEHLHIVLLVVIALVGICAAVGSTEMYKSYSDRMKLKAPITGAIMRSMLTARFARIFSMLYSGGIPAARAMEMSLSAMDNRHISAQADNALHCVRSGMTLAQALGCINGFDGRLIDAVLIGEESGRIDELLDNISEICDREASAAIKRMLKLIEPVLIMVAAAVILTVVLSVMLPIYDMYSGLGAAGRL